MMLPFALKAGTIGKLELKVPSNLSLTQLPQISLLQMWNGPLEVSIDDLFIILGPNLNVVSHDESYIEEKEDALEESYDDANMFNIFEHQLKLKKKGSK